METISTLRYAGRAKSIENRTRINDEPKDALLRHFQEEIAELRKQLEEAAIDGVSGDDELDDDEDDDEEDDDQDEGDNVGGNVNGVQGDDNKESETEKEKKKGKKDKRRKSKVQSDAEVCISRTGNLFQQVIAEKISSFFL